MEAWDLIKAIEEGPDFEDVLLFLMHLALKNNNNSSKSRSEMF